VAVRGTGGGAPPPKAAQEAAAAAEQTQKQEGPTQELKARNAAGKQAHSSPKSEYQRPHRVHTSAERRAADARHHEAALRDMAAQNIVLDVEIKSLSREEEIEEDTKLKGVSLDEKRNKRGRKQNDEENEKESPEDAARSLGISEGSAGKYFQDMPVDRMGDPTLANPNEMKRLLGPSVRFAQHAMLLAEARLKEGLERPDALKYLASLYLGLADRAYANKALREFGAATGIVELYPLELMKHLMEHVPSFMSRVSTAAFLSSVPVEGYKGKAGVPIKLAFDAGLRIRGFAVKGGAKPGYVLEPMDPPGTYHLTFGTAGSYTVMLSALEKVGTLHIQEFAVEVAPGDAAALEASAAVKRERTVVEGEEPPADGAAPAPTAKIPAATTDPAAKKKDLTFTMPRKI